MTKVGAGALLRALSEASDLFDTRVTFPTRKGSSPAPGRAAAAAAVAAAAPTPAGLAELPAGKRAGCLPVPGNAAAAAELLEGAVMPGSGCRKEPGWDSSWAAVERVVRSRSLQQVVVKGGQTKGLLN